MIKKIVIRFFLLVALLIAFNFIYQKFFLEKDLIKHSDIIENLRNVQDSAEVIYFGESSNFTSSPRDNDKRRISEFISDYYPNKKFAHVDKGALHAEIYLNLLKNIPEDSPLETVIITLNLRSFNADWRYSELETALQKSLVLLKNYPPLVNRFILSFKGYDIKSNRERLQQVKREWKKATLKFPFDFPHKNVTEWDYACAQKGVRNPDSSKNQKLTELACHYIKTYAFQIDVNSNPRIKDYDEIVEYCKARGWNLVLNLLAENIDQANELVGEELIFLMKQNQELLLNRYHKNDVIVVDNFTNVPSAEYIDKDWTTEHYAEKGRKIIAKNVANAIKNVYPENFIDVNYSIDTVLAVDTIFFTDLESKNDWGQQQSITSEQAYSGSKSSKTNKDSQYGITLEKPLHLIPIEYLKNIKISAQILSKGFSEETQIVLEIIKNGQNVYWKGFKLSDMELTTSKWQQIEIIDYIPEVAFHSDIVKIYLWNPSAHNVYIDDFRIEFLKE